MARNSSNPFQLPRSSRSRQRRPWWLPLVVLALAWLYSRFQPEPQPQRDTTPRTQPRSRRTPRPQQETSPDIQAGDSRDSEERAAEPGGRLVSDTVVRVSDGDTVKLRRIGTVRLIGVDTPEKAQEGGPEAAEFTRATLLNQKVQVELCAKQPHDRYGRSLGFIYIANQRGQRVLFNKELVRQGYARVYSLRPCTVDETEWGALYEQARVARRGLFAKMDEVPDAAAFRRQARSRP
jgi:endonuclease YncB( thermonuclease family)